MAAFDTLSFSFTPSRTLSAKANKTGATFQPIQNVTTLNTPGVTVGTTIANASAGGGDMVLSKIYSIGASSSTTIDLTSFTDFLERTGGALARVKYLEAWLLSAADDATSGTAASSVTIGDAASNPFLWRLGGTTPTFTLANGEQVIWSARSAAGIAVGSAKNLKIANNDAGVAAAVLVTIVGGTT
jgi:hypothetical protein